MVSAEQTDATTTVDLKLSGLLSLAAGTTQTVIAPGSSTGSLTLTLVNTTCNTLSTALTICVTDNSLRTTTLSLDLGTGLAANIDHGTTTAGLSMDINLITNDIPNTVVLVTIGTISSHGFVTDLGGGIVRYTSTDATFAGLDCFDYTASIGACSLSGTLKISVLSSTSTTLTATYIGTRDNSAGNGQTFGLGGIISIVVSPDCKYVYAAGAIRKFDWYV